MHETGIAAEILDIAEREAGRRGAAGIASITIQVGDLSGVVAEALEFAFDALAQGTQAAGATLRIEKVAVRARCPRCCSEVAPGADLVLWCAECGQPLEVIAGQELNVRCLELMEAL